MSKSRNILPPRVFWTKQQIDLLHEHYPHKRTEDLVLIIGREVKSMWSKASQLGIKKSYEFLLSEALRLHGNEGTSEKTQFKKGHIPFNKGKKGVNYPGMRATQFKKGQLCGIALEKYRPVGAERISKDGYLERKIHEKAQGERNWRAVHILVWEEQNGPLPKGHAVVFKDGNQRNIEYENLECITRAELMSRNTYHRYPKEISQLIQLRGAVTRQINKRMKNDEQLTATK